MSAQGYQSAVGFSAPQGVRDPFSRSSVGDRRSMDGVEHFSPTAGTPHAPRRAPTAEYPQHPPIGRLTLLATTDGHKFASADVSGSTSSAAIREKIFTALEIPDDEQPAFLLRRHAMGGGALQVESSLDGDTLYQYCAEGTDQIKGVLAVMSFEQSHPSMPIMPPPIPHAPSSATSKRSDEYAPSLTHYTRRPTSQSETTSSISDLLQEESEYFRRTSAEGQLNPPTRSTYPTSSSETSLSTTDMDQHSGGTGSGPSSLKRKPHQRRTSHMPGGPRRPSSPSSGGSRRAGREGSTTSSIASPTSPAVSLQSPDSLSVDPNLYGRYGSVTPTRPPLGEQQQQPQQPSRPSSQRRPPSMSPEEIQQMGSSESINEQERILRAIQEDRERDRRMVEEMIQREREEEMAREWERRDREEEAERRRRQIQEDEETAMAEQRKEQELYKARLDALERERSLRSQPQPQLQAQQQRQSPVLSRDASVPVNEFGDWGYQGGRAPQGYVQRSVPVGAGRASSLPGYPDPYRSTQTVAHRGPDPEFDGAGTMLPSSRFASQSALASQLMGAASHQRPPLHINVQSPSSSQVSTPHGSFPGGAASRGTTYPQMAAYAPSPHPGLYSSSASASSQDLANRRRQGTFTPQPLRPPYDARTANFVSSPAVPGRNLQQMRSNPNFRGGMPLPGQNRPRPPPGMQPAMSALPPRGQDSLYATGVQSGVRSASQTAGRPPNPGADQMYAQGVTGRVVASPPASLSPPMLQGSFSGHPSDYLYERVAPPPISTYSRNPSPNRSPLPMGPNSPRSPSQPAVLRTVSPRPSTMYDAGQGAVAIPALPRRPSSHYDPPSAPHDTNSFHAPVVPLARSPNQDVLAAQQRPFPSLPPASAGPRSALDPPRDHPSAGHARFATEGASSPLPVPVDVAPPPPYVPSPDLQLPSTLPTVTTTAPPQPASAPSSPNLARNSAYGGLFDYMVNPDEAPESVSPNSTETEGGTEIGYHMLVSSESTPEVASTQAEDEGSSDDSGEDDEDTGTNALFLPQRPPATPASQTPSVSFSSQPSTVGSDVTVRPPARVASDDEGEFEGDSTFTARMRSLALDGNAGDTMTSDESTLGPSGKLSNRSLPPIDTSSPASSLSTPSSALHGASHPFAPLSSASPDVDTPGSDSVPGPQQLATNLRRKKTVFEKNEGKQWAFRPPAEQVVRELSRFFPEINLEAEFIETNASPATAAAPPAPSEVAAATSRETKLKNRKSIRRVAEERQRSTDTYPAASTLMPTSSGSQLAPPTDVKVVRRRSTRMWDGKVEEVKPSALKEQLASADQDVDEASLTFKWVKGDLIGKGAYGRVYLGLNATTGEMLAVKQVEVPSTISDRVDDRQSQVIAALRSEIQLLKDLDHPNVVQYLGFEESEDFISIFLEYVPGGSLGSVFRKYGKLQEDEVRWFTRQILDGLEYLHGRGILHRDLKGDNILVDPNNNGVVKITDFGVSKQTLEEATQMGGTLMTGSLYWMAPEVVTNAGRGYNSKIDLWSLGCVVLEMLSGARPWQGLEMMPIILKLGHGERPPMPTDLVLSPAAADFVYAQSFAVDPDARFSATDALRHPFVQLDPSWSWERDSELARKVLTAAPGGGGGGGGGGSGGRGRRKNAD